MSLKSKFFTFIPYFVQNVIVTLVNTNLYRVRHSGKYQEFRKYYLQVDLFTKEQLDKEVARRSKEFHSFITENSVWYSNYKDKNLLDFPLLEKKDVLLSLDQICTLNEKEGIVSLTGGTTGASMKVIYTKYDMQERFAILDHFRSKHGYELGKKTAWFSGKNLITEYDIKKDRCAHYDYKNKIRFYSTFLINTKNFDVYWRDLEKFQPEFIVGFPSSVYELCRIAKSKGLKLSHTVDIFFPTAETVLDEHRTLIYEILGCKLVDQYASSEGAPFILECKHGGLHIHPLTGIFEVVDNNLRSTKNGELLVTSFTTHGTPLVRYRIGDSVELGGTDEKCCCQSPFPLVKKIQGRTTDYVYSPEYGKVNLGNISNATKDVIGIICFQIVQDNINKLDVFIVASSSFNEDEQTKFISALRERVGEKIIINVNYVDDIVKEKSGKFRIVKNSLKIEN